MAEVKNINGYDIKDYELSALQVNENQNKFIKIDVDNSLVADTVDLSSCESTTNKVTTLSSSSTDVQYPSAKVVYDTTEEIREIASGRTKNYVTNITKTPALNTLADLVEVTSFVTIDNLTILPSLVHTGDNVYVTETDVPDRWVSGLRVDGDITYIQLHKLETAKAPVTDVKVNGTTVVSNTVANVTVPTFVETTLDDYLEHEAEYSLTNNIYFVEGTELTDVSLEER